MIRILFCLHIFGKVIPWIKILKSRACMSLCFAGVGTSWFLILLLTNSPLYMKEALKFDIKSNSLLAIPYTAIFIVLLTSSFVSGKLVKRFPSKLRTIRIIFNFFGTFRYYCCVSEYLNKFVCA